VKEMELFFVVVLFSVLVIVSLLAFVVRSSGKSGDRGARELPVEEEQVDDGGDERDQQPRGGRVRRRGIASLADRVRRNQERDRGGDFEERGEEETGEIGGDMAMPSQKKIGKKKLEKMKRKEEKRRENEYRMEMLAQRRQEEEEKYEQMMKEKQEEKERKKEEEEKEKERMKQIEEEKEKEFQEWSTMFSVEESGVESQTEEEKDKIVNEMVEYIKKEKVVELEDLAAEFRSFKTNEIVDKLTELDQTGVLTGILDDRGKFIHITQEEMENVVKFINRRGRVSIEDIVGESNRLIDLNPRD